MLDQRILGFAYLSVLIKDKVVGFVKCSKGVRQGDPLSPLLFVLSEEVLNRALHAMFTLGEIKRIVGPRSCELT